MIIVTIRAKVEVKLRVIFVVNNTMYDDEKVRNYSQDNDDNTNNNISTTLKH